MEFGASVEALFGRGIDAWKDIEVAKNYAANDSRPVTRDANGNIIAQGTPGVNGLIGSFAADGTLQKLGLAVVAGLVVWLIVRRLK